jgi:tetratricopeptide (TPR) repeat protein
VPLDWAQTQSNLGSALATLGARRSSTGRVEKAVTAFREALKEHTRDRVPLDWATTQHNLGAALGILGELKNGTGYLEEAVTAYREALKERTRERVPLDWAATQNGLGLALWRLGEQESGTARLEEARRTFVLAWSVFRQAGMDRYDPWFETRLRSIDDLIASRLSIS